MSDFNVNQFVNDLQVNSDDVTLMQTKDLIAMKHIVYDDAWSVRQSCCNEAWGMLSHIRYIGGSLLANAEQKRNRLQGNGILSESIDVNWGKAPNAERPHENDEISIDDQVDAQENFITDLKDRMRRCAISYVLHVQEHDDISRDLDQLTFSAIQAKSAARRAA